MGSLKREVHGALKAHFKSRFFTLSLALPLTGEALIFMSVYLLAFRVMVRFSSLPSLFFFTILSECVELSCLGLYCTVQVEG